MDETAIPLHQIWRPGLLSATARSLKRQPRGIARNASRGERRTMFTLLAFVCNDEDVQQYLPQIMLFNAATTTASEIGQIRQQLPENVFLWVETKAWNTAPVMNRAVNIMAKTLQQHKVDRQIILMCDVFRAHMTRSVWKNMTRLRIFYMLIPAKMTWALQPCDTHVFSIFKRHLSDLSQAAALRNESGRVPTVELVGLVGEVITTVLRGRAWANAFAQIGLNGQQCNVSKRVLSKLGLAETPRVQTDDIPSLADLKEVWPARSIIPLDTIFAAVVRAVSGDTTAVADLEAPPAGSLWLGRLRSSAQLRPRPSSSGSAAWPTVASSSAQPSSQAARLPQGRLLWKQIVTTTPTELGVPLATSSLGVPLATSSQEKQAGSSCSSSSSQMKPQPS